MSQPTRRPADSIGFGLYLSAVALTITAIGLQLTSGTPNWAVTALLAFAITAYTVMRYGFDMGREPAHE